jgi:hypothetical protein
MEYIAGWLPRSLARYNRPLPETGIRLSLHGKGRAGRSIIAENLLKTTRL